MDVPTDIRIIGLRNLYRTDSRSSLVYKVAEIQETTTARAHKSENKFNRPKTWHGLENGDVVKASLFSLALILVWFGLYIYARINLYKGMAGQKKKVSTQYHLRYGTVKLIIFAEIEPLCNVKISWDIITLPS